MNNNSTAPGMWTLNLTGQVVVTIIFGTIIFIGIIGNVLVITLIILVKKMHSALNMCLASLSVADLIVLLFLPIIPWNILYGVDASILGKNFCIFLSSIDRGAFVCSVLTFVLISVERYTVLCHPLKTIGMWTYKKVGLLLAIIWAVTVAVSVPYGFTATYGDIVYGNKTWITCYLDWTTPWLEDYDTVLICIAFFLPASILIVLYIKMAIALKTKVQPGDTEQSSTRKKKSLAKVIWMLCVLVTVFVVCLLPFKIFVLVYIYAPDILDSMDVISYFALNWFCRIIIYINHSINPIAYFLMSDGFREAFKDIFCKKWRKFTNAVNTTAVG